jgi:hypothetical protein|tara:strand:+ start:614 stop:796 length:183 start_codon:yes stop_codon:yes gene_type:complete
MQWAIRYTLGGGFIFATTVENLRILGQVKSKYRPLLQAIPSKKYLNLSMNYMSKYAEPWV